MNSAIGSGAVYLGLFASIAGAFTVGVGVTRGRPELMRLAGRYAGLLLAAAVLAVAIMERALIDRDFTVQYVANHGSSRTPRLFNIATLWGALEGSLLLWALVLAGYVMAVARRFRDRLTDPLVGWAMITLFLVAAFFFYLLAGPADPFIAVTVPPGYDGPGPNPLLQNHILMAVHPPLLYLGYVGFTVPFAFAIGALVTGRVGEGWLLETRRWTLLAWGCLTGGIVLGAWWSYEVLGWGGYWAWDPVENASLLPWLTGTAYLHSVIVQERRGMLRVWNLSLLCATFALTILGTFLTRSGVLDSVHAFSESEIGPTLLAFFAVVVLVSVGLVGWRGDQLRSPGRMDSPASREGAFLVNNLLFAAFAFVVLVGTVFPLIVEAITNDRISVGVPYFNRMTMPIGFCLLFLMAVAPALPWRKASTEVLSARLIVPAWIGAAGVVFAGVIGARGFAPVLAFGLGGFAGGAALRQLVLAVRRQGWRGVVGRTNGGMVVHLGVVLVAVAFAASSSYLRQGELIMAEGEPMTFAGHTFVFEGIEQRSLPEKDETRALVTIDGAGPYTPAISKFSYASQQIGTPSVRTALRDDIQLSVLALPTAAGEPATIRVTVQPLIVWLWIGGGVMGLGTVLAAVPTRRGATPRGGPAMGARDAGPLVAHDEAPAKNGAADTAIGER